MRVPKSRAVFLGAFAPMIQTIFFVISVREGRLRALQREIALRVQRANTQKLRDIFNKYASVENINGQKFMTPEDFLTKYLGIFPEQNCNMDSLRFLASSVNPKRDGLISFPEFQAFEGLLCFPDALYKTAFQLFDTNGNGEVSFDEFVLIMRKTELYKHIKFNVYSGFVDLYFGKGRDQKIGYSEFSQFIHDFHEEYAIEAFRRFDKTGTGFISLPDFEDIMISIKKHLLTSDVQSHLVETASKQTARSVSFPYFIAFNSLLNNMELIKKIYLNVTHGHRHEAATKEAFMHSAQRMSQITPLEVDILYQLCDALHETRTIVYSDLIAIAPEPFFKEITRPITEIHAVTCPEERNVFIQILEVVYRFSLGALAGAIGAATVYPLDIIKTRIQNQRPGSGGVMYKNGWDCFTKIIQFEGVSGLYKGLLTQVLGSAPEKAIKFAVHDFVRDKFVDENGKIAIYYEILAGVSAGSAQLLFTNPLEIVKIRLQTSAQLPGGKKASAFGVIKDLGLSGLFKGAKACLMRDATFNGIYFPTYAHVKAALADENGYNHPATLLLAGAISGVPAATLATPADVIKTRLQVVARQGETTYSGPWDAVKKIHKEEGFKAFWKGTTARVVRSSPQFGVTLLTYEILQRLFYVDFCGLRPTGSEIKVPPGNLANEKISKNPEHIGGYQMARPIFTGIETKFGLSLPKFDTPT